VRPLPRHQQRVRRPNPVEGEERPEDDDNAQTGIGDVGKSPGRAATLGAATGLPAGRGDTQGAGASPRRSEPVECAMGSPGGAGMPRAWGAGGPTCARPSGKVGCRTSVGSAHKREIFTRLGGSWWDTHT
jgi:hypothetical protein